MCQGELVQKLLCNAQLPAAYLLATSYPVVDRVCSKACTLTMRVNRKKPTHLPIHIDADTSRHKGGGKGKRRRERGSQRTDEGVQQRGDAVQPWERVVVCMLIGIGDERLSPEELFS